MFNLTFPDGDDQRDTVDFHALQTAGRLQTWTSPLTGRVHLSFAPPFDDLEVIDGETLTSAKAARMDAAMAYFGAIPTTSKD